MVPLPIGTTVTLFFTDIEGSTRLLDHLGEDYGPLLAEQRRLLRSAIQRHGGEQVDTQGDALFAVFSRPSEALVAAVEAQQAILTHSWPREAQVRVRIGLHTGEPFRGWTGYFGTDVHRAARICAAAHGGQVVLSTRTRNLIMDALPDTIQLRDLGQHRLKDLANPERLFQVVADGLPADFPPLRTLNVVPHNLPIQLTAFIGREHEREEIRAMVTASRLVTLAGPGGAGKTRLAIQVAADLADAFIDGVWLADLAPLSEGSLLPQVVASALRLREQPGQPMTETITDYLRPRALLLLLDNCEHMLRECAELVQSLLLSCPGLRILATSREALGIPGEVLSPLGPLSLPDPRRMPAVAEILQCDAVRLFAERARAISPAFAITSQNASPVAEICLRLDGIPLALELAAARVKVLTVDEIASRLEDRFRLLVQGSRTALPRQRTLQATMDWSYDLLSDQERIVLCRLAVFAGGFTLDAAESVCAGTLEVLAHLVDKSLVIAEAQNGTTRYRLLETVREYAIDRLEDSGDLPAVRFRHRDWFLALVEQVAAGLRAHDSAHRLDTLETEADNLRGAIEWSLRQSDGERAVRLVKALSKFWESRGYYAEGRSWVERTLAILPERTRWRADALYVTGTLAWNQGELAAARSLLEECLAIRRELGDSRWAAAALNGLGLVAWNQGDLGQARAFAEESLVIFRDLRDERGVTVALNTSGIVSRAQGDYPRARAIYTECVERARRQGDRQGEAIALGNLGNVAFNEGDYGRAQALNEEALTVSREVGAKRHIAASLNSLGGVMRALGEPEKSASLHKESLVVFKELGDKWGIAEVMTGIGVLNASVEEWVRAATLFGAAEALREVIGSRMAVGDRAEYDRSLIMLRQRLDEEAIGAAWIRGRSMSVEDMVDYVLHPPNPRPLPTGRL